MKDLLLSPHFKLAEFERSATAVANHIDNRVPSQYIPALEQLCRTILEPLRTFANSPEGKQSLLLSPSPSLSQEVPIIISSGYRCNALNVKIGGAYASQHTLGEAADIQIPKTAYTDWDDNRAHTDMDILNRWFSWIDANCNFDQLILETSNDKDFWIHVSCRKNIKANRHQIFRYMKKH